MLRGPPERRMTPVVKSTSRKFALLLRGKGEMKRKLLTLKPENMKLLMR
jgi:hypothetical protein